ncbi:MAG: hypothetical protein EBT03_07300 [Betaproteobacteria bacterium]|nr:hypothetical protein [Betaproteobacteria bacterium]NCA17117.1 hypothetical protein [Betaproteobacteria bacterium]
MSALASNNSAGASSASYDVTAIALGRKEAAKRAAVATAKWWAQVMKGYEENVCKDCVKHHPLDYHNIGCCGHCELDGKCNGSPSMGDTLDARPVSTAVIASLQALASANRAAAVPLKTRIERHVDMSGAAIEVELVDSDEE